MTTALEFQTAVDTRAAAPSWCLTVARDGREDHARPDAGFSISDLAGSVVTAVRGSVSVLLEGMIYNRAELLRLVDASSTRDDADLVVRVYERLGDGVFPRLRGAFAIVVRDDARRVLLAARDPLGVQPLFYSEIGDRFVFSPSPDRIVRAPGVSARVDPVVVAEWLAHRWPTAEGTFFESVKRLPPGHMLRADAVSRKVTAFWSPAPVGEPVDWLTERDLDGFDGVFSEAVDRTLRHGPSGIFLSGGLDSVSVAAVAADLTKRQQAPFPLALSLGFPDEECNEQPVQTGVARGLGLEQVLVPFSDAAGPEGLLQSALDLAAGWPQPMIDPWTPPYMHLASMAAQRGRRVILTGMGGDEWLTVSPFHTADLLRVLDVPGVMHLLLSIKRSYSFSWGSILRYTFWKYGVRPWLAAGASVIASGAMQRSKLRRLVASTPTWVAPDPRLRRELDARAERHLVRATPEDTFYLREIRQSVADPLHAIEMENVYERGRRTGAVTRHPFWDRDLIEFLVRVPPRLLNQGWRTKGLVRQAIARRFPDLGFERHRKVFALRFFRATLTREARAAWARQGGPKTLASMGVLDLTRASNAVDVLLTQENPRRLITIWNILHLEAWARTWA